MQPHLRLAAAIAAVTLLGACAEAPTSSEAPSLKRESKAAERAALLASVPVAGALSDGGSFVGTFTATRFDIDPATRQLSMSGVLNGSATDAAGGVTAIAGKAFSAPVALTSEGPGNSAALRPASNCDRTGTPAPVVQQASFTLASAAASCDVLFLDLGPIFLDVLGLTVDLSQVVLDINAVSGAGNLLGNLLCGLLGLLDGIALLAAITQFLDLINNILAGLSGVLTSLPAGDALDIISGSRSA